MSQSLSPADRAIEVHELISSGRAPELRIKNKLSLETSARSMGVSAAALYRWERQERQPRGRNVDEYHKFLRRLIALEKP